MMQIRHVRALLCSISLYWAYKFTLFDHILIVFLPRTRLYESLVVRRLTKMHSHSAVSSISTWYMGLLSSRHGTLTKSLTAGLIGATGDAACQASNGDGGIDGLRTARMASWALLTTPLVARWYTALNSRWPASPLRRMIADQLIWAPPATASMLLYFGAAESVTNGSVCATETRDYARNRMTTAFVPTLAANWSVWPIVQLVNFALVPPRVQILFSNLVGVGWSFALSSLANPRIIGSERHSLKMGGGGLRGGCATSGFEVEKKNN